MIQSTLTCKGQTTIPSAVRKALNLKPRQRLIYEIKGSNVMLKVDTRSLLSLYGALHDGQPAADKKTMRESYRKARIKRYAVA